MEVVQVVVDQELLNQLLLNLMVHKVDLVVQVEGEDSELDKVEAQVILHQLAQHKELMEDHLHLVRHQLLLMQEVEEVEQLPLVQMVLIIMEEMVVQD